MTAIELVSKFANRQGTITEHGLTFNVKTTDVRNVYGNVQVKIVPLAGIGERWIDARNFKQAV